MKYFVMLGDGMADEPIKALGGKTPLQVANIKTMDRLASLGQVGLVKTVPDGYAPGSDVANLSVLGYAPERFYTGRSPLEALSLGIDIQENQYALRCNLVTIIDGVMVDYSAGEISTAEAKELIKAVEEGLGNEHFKFYSGVSYRHCLITDLDVSNISLTPPHDISGKNVDEYFPKSIKGSSNNAEILKALILKSEQILKNHAINLKRIKEGKNPATHIFLWGAGSKPSLTSFEEMFGLKGAVISAVDLLKGIAIGAKMFAPNIEGATATLESNFKGKTDKVIECFENGFDFVYLHLEAPDEEGHNGRIEGKIKAIEIVDRELKIIWDYLESKNEPYVLALLPDHRTPIATKTHSASPVPYVIYKSTKPFNSGLNYSELDAQSGIFLQSGQEILLNMIKN